MPKCNQLKIYYKFYSNESHNKVENNENPLAEFNSITMTTFIFSLQTNEMVDENAEFALHRPLISSVLAVIFFIFVQSSRGSNK